MTGAVLAGPAVRAIQDNPVVRAIQDQKVSPGVLGFLVVAALGVATWLLVRSMTRQMRKIDFSEDAIDVARQTRPDPGTVAVGEAGAGEPDKGPDGSPRAAAEGDDAAGPGGDLR